MLDFFKICHRTIKKDCVEIYPKFIIGYSEDLIIRGGDFYAVWCEDIKLWSTKEDSVKKIIDRELDIYADKLSKTSSDTQVIRYMWDSDSGSIDRWHKYVQKQSRDSCEGRMLDGHLIFANTETKKEDYASKRLPYSLVKGDHSAYDELMDVLYSKEERTKIEWAIGSIVSGDSVNLQKFLVLYGPGGTGKSTVIHIIEKLFQGYWSVFDAKALGQATNAFALEAFKSNPLVAIQHDGDLSRIEDNTKLNSVVSHESMTVNEKFKGMYTNSFRCFLFMATNKPVKITDAKSGILRRLIDVKPTGKKLPEAKYNELYRKIDFELGAIASHCLDIYENNKTYFNSYVPTGMMSATNDFYNFVLDNSEELSVDGGVSLDSAWALYGEWTKNANLDYSISKRKFKNELANYFDKVMPSATTESGKLVREVYVGLKDDSFSSKMNPPLPEIKTAQESWISLSQPVPCVLDLELKDCQAQYAISETEPRPRKSWSDVGTTLFDLDTYELHFVRPPLSLIVLDFDLKDADGNKSLELNLKAASKWPKTYAEVSKSGQGIHLHYYYDGDPLKLDISGDGTYEIKVFSGLSPLRRKRILWNDLPIAHISSGLPLRKEKEVSTNLDIVSSEKELIAKIKYALAKKVKPGSTVVNVQYINKVLNDAYTNKDLIYDVSVMKDSIRAFANGSTNHALECLKMVKEMKFKSEKQLDNSEDFDDDTLIFFDCEVFPNLFVLCWKKAGEENETHGMINPNPKDLQALFFTKGHMKKLVGFNNRNYDNHIVYAWTFLGYSNYKLYKLSKNIISGAKNSKIGNAYNLSYTDIYDFSSEKKSLKKFEIELKIHHQELGLDWDEPVKEELWDKVVEYCKNDVMATEAVFNARHGDFRARQILAELSGGTVNDTTNTHTAVWVFDGNKNPQSVFNYRNLAEPVLSVSDDMRDGLGLPDQPSFVGRDGRVSYLPYFPGYSYENGVSMYRGVKVGEGGWNHSNPGMYKHVVTFDVTSEHPSSMIAEWLFGPYTRRVRDLVHARVCLKFGKIDEVKQMFGGKLAKYLDNPSEVKALTKALKIVINSIYGLTAAKFDNAFRDERNIDNIVAKRGALFMIDLLNEVEAMGATVVHIKTDSIKIADPTPEVYDFIMNFGKRYGYSFDIEHKYERLCLVNKAAYIAKCADDDPDPDMRGKWTATAAQFKVPYVFKTLFSKEPIEFDDMCEVKGADTSIWIDFNENLPEGKHDYRFVGKVGQFTPVKPGCGGGDLVRLDKTGGYSFAQGAKGYKWKESEVLRANDLEDQVDEDYYKDMASKAIETINQYCDFDKFANG